MILFGKIQHLQWDSILAYRKNLFLIKPAYSFLEKIFGKAAGRKVYI